MTKKYFQVISPNKFLTQKWDLIETLKDDDSKTAISIEKNDFKILINEIKQKK